MTSVPVPNPGATPGTHALVIGVSDYPFAGQFELQNLSSAARSASEIAAWLLDDYYNPGAPLASLRVLLSPSAEEAINPRIQGLQEPVARATRQTVEQELIAFRANCRESTDNVAFVYIVGHGAQLNSRGSIVLLSDFGDPNHLNFLDGAIDVAGCHAGMNGDGIAGKQIWFADACRQQPKLALRFELEDVKGALTLDQPIGHVEASPLFLASSTRESSYAVPGGKSLFCQALLWALGGAAASGPSDTCALWHVGSTELIRVLPDRVRRLAAAEGEIQHVDVAGRPLEVVAQRFPNPPQVGLTLNLKPANAAPLPQARLLFDGQQEVSVCPPWPLKYTGPAGLYTLDVRTQAPYQALLPKPINLAPPKCVDEVEVRT
jgi:hypothetical protein